MPIASRFFVPLFTALLIAFSAQTSAEYVSPETVPGSTYVDAGKAKELFDRGVLFVDVRVASDFDAGRIPGAEILTIERDEAQSPYTEASLLELAGSKDTEMVMYCNSTSCWRSAVAAERAVAWGFTKVYYYRFGFPDWQAAGYPVE